MKRVVSIFFLLSQHLLFSGTHKPATQKIRYVITSSYNAPFQPKENVLWFSNTNIGKITAKAFSHTDYPLVTVQLDLNQKEIISQFSCVTVSATIKRGFVQYLEKNLCKHGCTENNREIIKRMLCKKLFAASPCVERKLR